ncbi:MAG: acyl carrier protein [Lachnospiraceae bacterium]|nr:acyl carrier protein [Lachnospiraceae bacterium]
MTEKIIKYISAYQNIPMEKITEKSHLVKDLGMTSLDMMEMACAIEEHFDIEFDEDELVDLLTVQKIADYVEKNGGN